MKTIIFCLGILLFGQLIKSSEANQDIYAYTPEKKADKPAGSSNKKPEFISSGKKAEENPTRIYAADLPEGTIGHGSIYPLDDPFDNVFHLFLDEAPGAGDIVWLKYELDGVQDFTAVSRSINDRQAVGGYFIQKKETCTPQQEQIAASWLKKGDNVIRFSLPEGAGYHYKIYDLTLEVEKNSAENKITEKNIILNLPSGIYYENKAYLQGFLTGSGVENVKLYADRSEIPLIEGEFEYILEKPANSETLWQVELRAIYPDGAEVKKNILFDTRQTPEFTRGISAKGMSAAKTFSPDRAEKLVFSGAQLEASAGALTSETAISITALRDIDLPPLNPDMVNVTKTNKAYRFLPHGIQFNKAVKIKLEYDPVLIPQGYSPKDVRTFFFDEVRRSWLELPLDSLDAECAALSSTTTHFTDFINGIIKVPESPETQGYKPTEIKDLKAPDPSAGITMIAPPSPNQMGTAGLQFPLKLPGGRQELQPQLAIQYNSEGGNGWLGMGWDLSIPSISIETRWGVPRYHPQLETETYLMGGEMLTPVAHRAAPGPRSSGDKQFDPRIESGFNKIIRHGTNPKNYWWEVTSKDGTRSFYGGSSNGDLVDNAVIKDNDGNIAQWYLREVRDLNDNFTLYKYITVSSAGVPGGTQFGRQIYIQEITYTGHGSKEGKYSVKFLRDRDMDDPIRLDVQINARLGFKQVTADCLRRIEVTYDQKPIRNYELLYEEGAFFKTLLSLIIEEDSESKEVYRHGFEYHDLIRGGGESYFPYENEFTEWTAVSDGIDAGMINPVPGFGGEMSLLGGSESSNYGFGAALTVGLPVKASSKEFSAGVNLGYSDSESSGLAAFVDIDGDNLPDKIFKHGNGLSYRSNPMAGDGKNFSEERDILNITQFSESESSSYSFGFEVSFGLFAGNTKTKSKTKTDVYFSDFNGDGLIDVAIRGTVWFNHINSDGNPEFTTNSEDTPNRIISGAALSNDVLAFDSVEQEKLIDENPLHDMVRVWRPPYPGKVTINAPVHLLEDMSNAAQQYSQNDGVNARIQLNDDVIIDQTNPAIGRNEFSERFQTPYEGIQVDTSDLIYFRLQSQFNGAYDQAHWAPEITYDSIYTPNVSPDEQDANGNFIHQFKASEDFILSAPQTVTMPFNGQVVIGGRFIKEAVTSDSLRLEIVRMREIGNSIEETVFHSRNYDWQEIVDEDISLQTVVEANDDLAFRIRSKTNINWKYIRYNPTLYYESATDSNFIPVTVTKPNGDPIHVFCPAAEFSMFNYMVRKTEVFIPESDGLIEVNPKIQFPLLLDFDPPVQGEITVSIKGINKLYACTTFPVHNDSISVLANLPLTADIPEGEPVYIEYHIPSRGLADSIARNYLYTDILFNNANVPLETGLFTTLLENEFILGPLYRGWGHFAYNGNRERADQLILREELRLNPDLKDVPTREELDQMAANPDSVSSPYDPVKDNFILLVADAKQQRWIGYDRLTWLSADTMSSSRLGDDDILLVAPPIGGSAVLNSPRKISISNATTWAGGGSVGAIGITGSRSDNTSITQVEVMDVDGDRHPDIIGPDFIQPTNPLGGREDQLIEHKTGVHESTGNSTGLSSSGSFPVAKLGNSKTSGQGSQSKSTNSSSTTSSTHPKSQDSPETAKSSIGITGSANFNSSSDHTVSGWLDVNGDGLVDKVFQDGSVRLNIGRKFLDPEIWGQDLAIREGQSLDFGAGIGLNFASAFNWGNMSVSGGVSVSKTENFAKKALQDVNGDGLLDFVVDVNPLKVRLNLGARFSDVIEWNGAALLDKGVSTGESANIAFTICIIIPIPFAPFKICINPNGSIGQGASREIRQFTDVNGDGYPDLVESTDEQAMRVRLSKIGKTNLLKTIHTPLGGAISLDYEITRNTYAMPHSKWLLASVETDDGLPDDGPSRMKTTFEYQNGYYDRRQREFYGFETVISRQLDTGNDDVVYRTTTQVYIHSDYYRKGILLSETLHDKDGKTYSETLNTYEYRDIHTGAILQDPYFTDNETGAVYPALIQTIENHYEGQPEPGLYTRIAYDYDQYGNVTSYTDDGNGDPAELIHARVGYHIVPDKHLVSIPSIIEVSINSGIIRKREADIDATGSITQIRQFLDGSTSANFDMEYDIYGNLTKITRPPNENGERVWFAYEYDDQVQTYPVLVRDAYGDTSRAVYDYRFGLPLETTDKNGQIIRYTLDAAGRIATVTSPYELTSGAPYTISNSYFPQAGVAYAVTRHFDPETGQDIETYTFMDGLARPVQVKKTGSFFAGEDRPDEVAMIVSGRVVFDGLGRTVEAYYPTREPQGDNGQFNDHFDNITPTKTTYDVLDRQLTTTLPDGSQTQMSYSIGPDNSGLATFVTAVTDALGNKKETYTDIRNRQRATTDHGPDGPIWTTFRYNAISELLKVTDQGGNETSYTYDQLGRKLTTTHPDNGLTEFFYDLSGNMTHKITAEIRAKYPDGGAIQYAYNLGRLIQIDYPKNFQNQVKFHYGTAGDQHNHNARGRIWLQEDATGGQEFFYGPLGEVTKTIRTVLINGNTSMTFISEQEYDTWNRIQKMKYPDGEVVDYHYNRAGKLNKMTARKLDQPYTFVEQLGYDKFEQRVFLKYGNGTTTKYEYEPERRRLSHLVARGPGRLMMDNRYEYDPMNNILSIRNSAQAGVSELGGATYNQFVYDDLYRLVSATGDQEKPAAREAYSLAMEYDNLHNIRHKSQVHNRNGNAIAQTTYTFDYQYDPVRPHAPTRIGDKRNTYDANGNQTGWTMDNRPDFRKIHWDEENRITAIQDNGYLSRYTYDAAGERVIKSHGGIQAVFVDGGIAGPVSHDENYTAYISPYLVFREQGFTKHYYIEDQRILSKIGTGDFYTNTIPLGQGITAGNQNYADRRDSLKQALIRFLTDLGYNVGVPSLEDNIKDLQDAGIQVPVLEPGDYTNPPYGWPVPPLTHADSICAPWPPDPREANATNGNVEAGYGFIGYAGVPEFNQFFYHPDHLGSTSYITDLNGSVRQYAAYIPFGEVFFEEHINSPTQPYLFNAKELDRETGLYYYGARYYDPRISLWASVDPMAEKYVGWSGYNYTLWNPVVLVDPDGRQVKNLVDEELFKVYAETLNKLYGVTNDISTNLNAASGAISPDNFRIQSSDKVLGEIQKIADSSQKQMNKLEKVDDIDWLNKAGMGNFLNTLEQKNDALKFFNDQIGTLQELSIKAGNLSEVAENYSKIFDGIWWIGALFGKAGTRTEEDLMKIQASDIKETFNIVKNKSQKLINKLENLKKNLE